MTESSLRAQKLPVLEVENLAVSLPPGGDRPNAVEHVSFTVNEGEVTCLIGESGSGKSVIASTVMGLLPKGLAPAEGSVKLLGMDLFRRTPDEIRRLRGAKMAMVFQEPMTALNPVMTCGDQMDELIRAHVPMGPYERRIRILDLFEEVRLPDPPRIFRSYPHQLSGGQRQRIVIAMALLLKPDLLICDEPTTALDVTTQASILKLILELQKKNGTAVLFITHDFGVVSEIADQVVVLELGKQIETGPAKSVLQHPKEPYTHKLINAVPELKPRRRPPVDGNPTLLEAKNVVKTYTLGGFFTGRVKVRALKGVSARLRRGETIGIVGESGSGKSTFARSIARLIDPTSGEVWVNGENVAAAPKRKLHGLRRRLQMVFQDPMASLNPHKKILDTIAMGLDAHHPHMDQNERVERVSKMMEMVGLNPAYMNRYPNQFSGGQRQRIGLGRALIMNPKLVIADEAISALDVSIQAQVVNLMKDIQKETNVAYLFIAHDLSMVRYISDRVGVMHKGHLVETGLTEEIFEHPVHPYTKSLLSAIPIADPVIERNREPMVYQYEKSGLKYNDCVMVNVSETHQVLMEKKI